MLKGRFVEKGYDPILDKELQEVSLLNSSNLLAPKKRAEKSVGSGFEWFFITTFSSHYWWVNKIFRKHWQVLKCDKISGPTFPDKPKVLYRKNQTLKDLLAPSAINPPQKISMFGNLKGFFPCRRCTVCSTSKTIKTSTFSSYVTSKVYNITDFITCGTIGVFYLFRCPCGFQ